MRVLLGENGDLLSWSDERVKLKKNRTPILQILINNHTIAAK